MFFLVANDRKRLNEEKRAEEIIVIRKIVNEYEQSIPNEEKK